MIDAGSLDYAHARLWARHGERPDEAAWRAIGPIRELPALLDAARNLAFRPWVDAIAPDADAHAIEARLIALWRTQVAEVQRWMPKIWRPAIAWVDVLADLPVVAHFARRGECLSWMRDDARYRALCEAAPAPPARGTFAPLASAWSDPDRLLGQWHAEWSRRIPRGAALDTGLIDACVRAVAQQRGTTQAADRAMQGHALAARLSSLFRRAMLDPAAAFVFLALCALDLERLRGELLLRVAFARLAPAS